MLTIDIFTLFPGIIEPALEESILGRAIERDLLAVRVTNIRDFAPGKHQVTDDAPYGGGGGMVMKPEPIFAAVEGILGSPPSVPLILLTPQGKPFTQNKAWALAEGEGFALLCGRYEGIDERVREHLAAEELSIGDYVLSGGELAALVVVEAVARLLPGALGDEEGARDDSHAGSLLEYPHYTRPPEFRGWGVPEVLLSGNHAEVRKWRRAQALRRTFLRRPDLLPQAKLTEEDQRLLRKWKEESAGSGGA
jgi:tRNA (guanine37-N1)-methyltransferase